MSDSIVSTSDRGSSGLESARQPSVDPFAANPAESVMAHQPEPGAITGVATNSTVEATEPSHSVAPSPLDPAVAPYFRSVLTASPTTTDGPAFASPAAMPEPGNTAVPAPRPAATPSAPKDQSAPTDADGIRPMGLAPAQSRTPSGAEGEATIGSGSGVGGDGEIFYTMNSGGSGGSGGGTPIDHDPYVHASGGAYMGSDEIEPGVYDATNEVYVGTVVELWIEEDELPDEVESIYWQGGTDYKGYISGDISSNGSSDNAVHVEVETGVEHQESRYTFIVDASPRTYDISVDVTYAGGGNGHSTFRFTSIAPDVDLDVEDGVPTFGYVDVGNPHQVHIRYTTDMVFTATTPPAPTDANGDLTMGISHYAFLQIVEPQRSWTKHPSNDTFYCYDPENDDIAWYLDDYGHASTSIAYGYVERQVGDLVFDHPMSRTWSDYDINNNSSIVKAIDAPGITLTPADAYKPANISNESFNMFLMFRPMDGVWIALAQVYWGYSATAHGGPYWWEGSASASPTVETAPLTGGAEFPNWSGRASQGIWQQ